jgi:muramoyltetrapeptide carboxypeptidase
MTTLRIIRASSREQNDLLAPRIAALRAHGFDVLYDDLPPDPTWLYAAAAADVRAAALTRALTEKESDVVVCARGGYGASDLLPLLPWDELARARPKVVVGFSDVSALQSALYARLGWASLHGPMPATVLWGQNGVDHDVRSLLTTLHALGREHTIAGEMEVTPVDRAKAPDAAGKLFGGCFTVLTNLFGTSYLPRSLKDHIVFIEDTDEHPARLMRAFNQWTQAGILDGARALVVGYLRHLGDSIPDCAPFVYEQFARRTALPVFHTRAFGHTCPNAPLMVGADARIEGGKLTWRFDPSSTRKTGPKGASAS